MVAGCRVATGRCFLAPDPGRHQLPVWFWYVGVVLRGVCAVLVLVCGHSDIGTCHHTSGYSDHR